MNVSLKGIGGIFREVKFRYRTMDCFEGHDDKVLRRISSHFEILGAQYKGKNVLYVNYNLCIN